LVGLPHAQQVTLTGRQFFPSLIAAPFRTGLQAAFDFAIVSSILGAIISWTRAGQAPDKVPLFGITPGMDHAHGKIETDSEGEEEAVREPTGAGVTLRSEAMS
jgi:hypothetical protein